MNPQGAASRPLFPAPKAPPASALPGRPAPLWESPAPSLCRGEAAAAPGKQTRRVWGKPRPKPPPSASAGKAPGLKNRARLWENRFRLRGGKPPRRGSRPAGFWESPARSHPAPLPPEAPRVRRPPRPLPPSRKTPRPKPRRAAGATSLSAKPPPGVFLRFRPNRREAVPSAATGKARKNFFFPLTFPKRFPAFPPPSAGENRATSPAKKPVLKSAASEKSARKNFPDDAGPRVPRSAKNARFSGLFGDFRAFGNSAEKGKKDWRKGFS